MNTTERAATLAKAMQGINTLIDAALQMQRERDEMEDKCKTFEKKAAEWESRYEQDETLHNQIEYWKNLFDTNSTRMTKELEELRSNMQAKLAEATNCIREVKSQLLYDKLDPSVTVGEALRLIQQRNF
jgi:hypothetical protein